MSEQQTLLDIRRAFSLQNLKTLLTLDLDNQDLLMTAKHFTSIPKFPLVLLLIEIF
mgnify:CR=1 FL=1